MRRPRGFAAPVAPSFAAASLRADGLRALRMVRAASVFVPAAARGVRVAVLRPLPFTVRDAAARDAVARAGVLRVVALVVALARAGVFRVVARAVVFLAAVARVAVVLVRVAAARVVLRAVVVFFAGPRVAAAFVVRETEPFGLPTLRVPGAAFAVRVLVARVDVARVEAARVPVAFAVRVVLAARVVFAAGLRVVAAFVVRVAVAFFAGRPTGRFAVVVLAAAAFVVRVAAGLRLVDPFGRPTAPRRVVLLIAMALVPLAFFARGFLPPVDVVVSSVLMVSSLSSIVTVTRNVALSARTVAAAGFISCQSTEVFRDDVVAMHARRNFPGEADEDEPV